MLAMQRPVSTAETGGKGVLPRLFDTIDRAIQVLSAHPLIDRILV